MCRNQVNRAFTLIELSIVLIIIGLLVGGVLAGRDLIKQAQMAGVTRDISSYKAAINTFMLKYGDGVWPGDMDNATSYFSGTGNGDGNGRVDTNDERLDAWQHLSLAGLVDGNYSGALDGGDYNSTNLPTAAYSGGFHHLSHSNVSPLYAFTNIELGAIIALAAVTDNGNGADAVLLPAAEARAYDEKNDDGAADTGRVLVVQGRLADDSDWTSNCVANYWADETTAGAWVMSTDVAACRLFFRIEE